MSRICRQYDRIAEAYDQTRHRDLMERPFLEQIAAEIPAGSGILDLGCGSGQPIAAWFIHRGYAVTGVDGAPAMLAFCRRRFAAATWLEADMRGLNLGRRFHAVIAWDSFFHLDPDSQRQMFGVFGEHLEPGGVLLFTSGHEHGEITNTMHGESIYHASLNAGEYRALLARIGCEVLLYRERDPQCGLHTVWLARRSLN